MWQNCVYPIILSYCFALDFNSLGRTPKRKLSLCGDDPSTPNAGFQRSLSTVSNESGTPNVNLSLFTSIDRYLFTRNKKKYLFLSCISRFLRLLPRFTTRVSFRLAFNGNVKVSAFLCKLDKWNYCWTMRKLTLVLSFNFSFFVGSIYSFKLAISSFIKYCKLNRSIPNRRNPLEILNAFSKNFQSILCHFKSFNKLSFTIASSSKCR